MIEKTLYGTEVLVGLGLSKRQAQVYLALNRAGESKARSLVDAAGVPRQEVYGLLLGLRQMGLVRQNLTTPATYTATPFTEVAKMLFEQRANELTLASQKAEKLTAQLSQPHPAPASMPTCFGTVSEGEGGRHYQKAIAKAQGSIEGVFSWVRFRQFSFRFEDELRAALKRDVALRFVAEKPCGHCLPQWIKSALPRYRFELRTLLNPPDAAVVLFDGACAAIASDKNVCVTRGIDLWTTHTAVTAVCQTYFYRVWANAQRQTDPASP
jgi:sugar-specific transcriptional regulator TrmB